MNMARPVEIISTITIKLQCFCSNFRRIAHMRMKTMLVLLVMVYRATSMYSKLHCERAMSRLATMATIPTLPIIKFQPRETLWRPRGIRSDTNLGPMDEHCSLSRS